MNSIFRKRAWRETERYVCSSSEWSITWDKYETASFLIHKHFSLSAFIILPANEVWVIYWFQSVRLSDMIFSTHVLGNQCMDFSEYLYTYYSPSGIFSYWLNKFPSFYRLFSVFGLWYYAHVRIYFRKLEAEAMHLLLWLTIF